MNDNPPTTCDRYHSRLRVPHFSRPLREGRLLTPAPPPPADSWQNTSHPPHTPKPAKSATLSATTGSQYSAWDSSSAKASGARRNSDRQPLPPPAKTSHTAWLPAPNTAPGRGNK